MFTTVIYLRFRSNFSTGFITKCKRWKCFAENTSQSNLVLHRKCFSKGSVDGDATQLLNEACNKEIKKIRELFPLPRVTLNELASRSPEKIFDVYYKQDIVTPKGSKTKPEDIKWLCTYAFTWPEKMKFEMSAASKRQAAESAASLAVQWLYLGGRMNKRGAPILLPEELKALQPSVHQPHTATITQRSQERIENLWNEYSDGIKKVYEATLNEAHGDKAQSAILIDDTAVEEDYLSSDEAGCEAALPFGSVHPVFGRTTQPSPSALQRRRASLQNTLYKYHKEKTELPIDNYTDKILSTLEESRVVVVAGSAGCGKSTRVPTALLGASAAVLVAEPRRLAALGLAHRVAAELNEEVGQTVGYQVRLRAKFPRVPSGGILYCTTGILLKRLQDNPGLLGCSAVILDEVHTREVRGDLSMALLRRALDLNPNLRLLLLSATMDTDLMASYFGGCPVLEVPGRLYPVHSLHLADIQSKYNLKLDGALNNYTRSDGRMQINCDEVAEVIKAVDDHEAEGAILTFLPGWAEIKHTQEILLKDWAQSTLHLVMPVHSRLSPEEQCKMFAHTAPGVRKVVLATNVAETSVTVPDVLHVIDCGAHRQNTLSIDGGTCSLELGWISRASAIQRAGRAGRLRPGFCYKLYTKEKEDEFLPHSTPEILRVPLQQVVLESKCLSPGTLAETFLAQLPQPPAQAALTAALHELIYLGALTHEELVTRLGALILSLGVAPALGRSLLLGAVLGAPGPAAVLTALSTDTPELFHTAHIRREEIRAIKRKYCSWSDQVAMQRILTRSHEELKPYDVAHDRLDYVKSVANLYMNRLLHSGVLDEQCETPDLARAAWVAVGASVSGAAVLQPSQGPRLSPVLRTRSGSHAHISNESVNYGLVKRVDSTARLVTTPGGVVSPERRALVVRDATLVSPLTITLFTSGEVVREPLEGSNGETTVLTIDRHKLQIHVPTDKVDATLKAREMLWCTFQYYVERDSSAIEEAERDSIIRFREDLVNLIYDMVAEASKQLGLDMPRD